MKKQYELKYRPDIDGLRALSVITILIFHLNQTWIPGGFTSVSIFFVISGFLITSIIKNQILQDRFSFKDFYARRIKRILPLFFVVVFTVFIFAVIILKPWDDYGAFWRTVRYAMQFRANRAFLDVDYFGPSADEKPLMHLWTLAIEEQFYFIWPITLVLLYKLFKRKSNVQHWLFWSSIVLIFASIASSLYVSNIELENPYFLLRARGAEILVGCAIALSPYTIPIKLRTPLGVLGIAMIILSYCIYSPQIAYPGFYALLPSIGAGLFIMDSNISSYKKVFTNKLAVTIGLWSFSIYLWHWPILAFMRYVYMDVNLPVSWMVSAYTLTIILSYFTYHFVENPVRKFKWNFTKSLIIIYIIPCIALSLMDDVVKSDKFKNISNLRSNDDLTRWFNDAETPCNNKITESCTIGDLSSDRIFLLVGDSHAAHIAPALETIAKKEHWKVDIISANSCTAFLSYDEQDFKKTPECIAVNNYLKNNWRNYDAVMFSQFYSGGYTEFNANGEIVSSVLLDNLPDTLNIIAKEKPVYLFSDVPNFYNDPLKIEWFKSLGLASIVPDLKLNKNYIPANERVKEIANSIDNVTYIDITKYIPESYRIDGNNLYRDVNHINPYASKKIGELFIKDQSISKEK